MHRLASKGLCPSIGDPFGVGVLATRALLFEVCTRAPDFFKLLHKQT